MVTPTDSPDFLITTGTGIRILGTDADTLNSVQASYFERFHLANFEFLDTTDRGA